MSGMRTLSQAVAALIAVMLVVFSGAAFAEDGDEDENDSGSKPAVVVLAVADLGSTGVSLRGEVNPGNRATTYTFEYGTTTAYGLQTPSGSAAASDSWQAVSARVEGLEPGTTYHYRLVARNALGSAASSDRTFTTVGPVEEDAPATPEATPTEGEDTSSPEASEETPPGGEGENTSAPVDDGAVEPELEASVAVEPGRGRLRVRRPGASSFAPLKAGSELPVGSEVDARKGGVALTAQLPSGESQTGRFGGGRFVIRQNGRGRVDLHLRGRVCPRRAAKRRAAQGSAVALTTRRRHSRRRSGRRLWGRDRGGRFRTHGKHSHATVRGTNWLVVDRCGGTLTRVSEGSVVVRDTVRRKRVIVRVGERYLARARR